MLIRVIIGTDSIFEVHSLIPLSHDATSAAENEVGWITHLSKKKNWHAKIILEIKCNVSMAITMALFPFYIALPV